MRLGWATTALFGAALLVLGFPWIAQAALIVFTGLLLATLLHGPTAWLHRTTGAPRAVALPLVIVTLGSVVLGSLGLFGYQIAGEAERLTQSLTEAATRAQDLLARYEWGRRLLAATPDGASAWTTAFGGGILSSTVHAGFAAVVVLFVGIYTAARPETYREGLLQLLPGDRDRMDELLDRLGETLHGWLLGQLASMTMVAALTAMALWLVGAPFALPLALLAGLLTFVPNVGPTIALVPAVLLALTKSPTLALTVFLVYVGVQTVESYLLTPLVQRRMVYLPPAVTITAQFLLWLFAGTLGLIVATPMTALVLATVRFLRGEDR